MTASERTTDMVPNPDFNSPCGHIDNFSMAIGRKVILRSVPYRQKVGTKKWVRDEENRYTCPGCGHKVFRGAIRCNRCNRPLDLD